MTSYAMGWTSFRLLCVHCNFYLYVCPNRPAAARFQWNIHLRRCPTPPTTCPTRRRFKDAHTPPRAARRTVARKGLDRHVWPLGNVFKSGHSAHFALPDRARDVHVAGPEGPGFSCACSVVVAGGGGARGGWLVRSRGRAAGSGYLGRCIV